MSNKVINKTYQFIDEHEQIKEVLQKFQQGYTERNLEKVNTFFNELFVQEESTYVVGTGTCELFLGCAQVKELIQGDWEEWGDLKLDLENVHIDLNAEVAWFTVTGSVKYIFEHSPEKYDRYINFIKNKAEDSELTPRQKIAFINWALSLAYHQRPEAKREELWPMRLSGVLLKHQGSWKFTHLNFSMTKDSYPDERFEHSKEHLELYNQRAAVSLEYRGNKINEELKKLLKGFETEFFGDKKISKELVTRYFGRDTRPYIIGLDNQLYDGIDKILQFFSANNNTYLYLDLDHAIASKAGETCWVSLTGTLKKTLTEDQLAEKALLELEELFKMEASSEKKLFTAHRKVASALKERASGINYTWPIRIDAVVTECNIFKQIHFSFPFYWIIEGKVDSL